MIQSVDDYEEVGEMDHLKKDYTAYKMHVVLGERLYEVVYRSVWCNRRD